MTQSMRRPRTFDRLTDRGRQRRLRRIALAALDEFGVCPERVTFGAEAEWMTVLRVEAGLPAPVVHRPAAGELPVTVTVTVLDVPGRRDCMLFDWTPGVVLRERATSRMRRPGFAAFVDHDVSELRTWMDASPSCRGSARADLREMRSAF